MKRRTDEQLIKAICSKKDREAEFQLIERYRRKAFYVAKVFYEEHRGSGISLDEYYSVALSNIVRAAKKYKKNTDRRFIAFFNEVARRSLNHYDYRNSYLRAARTFAGDESLDNIHEEKAKSRPMSEELGDVDPFIKGNIDTDDVVALLKKILKDRRAKDRHLFSLYLKGLSIKEIADECNIPASTVYRIIENTIKAIKEGINKQ